MSGRRYRTSEEIWSGPNLAAARAEARPGCCWFCDQPIRRWPDRKKAVTCGRERCQADYGNAHRRDRREARRA